MAPRGPPCCTPALASWDHWPPKRIRVAGSGREPRPRRAAPGDSGLRVTLGFCPPGMERRGGATTEARGGRSQSFAAHGPPRPSHTHAGTYSAGKPVTGTRQKLRGGTWAPREGGGPPRVQTRCDRHPCGTAPGPCVRAPRQVFHSGGRRRRQRPRECRQVLPRRRRLAAWLCSPRKQLSDFQHVCKVRLLRKVLLWFRVLSGNAEVQTLNRRVLTPAGAGPRSLLPSPPPRHAGGSQDPGPRSLRPRHHAPLPGEPGDAAAARSEPAARQRCCLGSRPMRFPT